MHSKYFLFLETLHREAAQGFSGGKNIYEKKDLFTFPNLYKLISPRTGVSMHCCIVTHEQCSEAHI